MIPLHARCRKCGKYSPPVHYSVHDVSLGLPPGWRLVVVSAEELNKYHDYVFCPDCIPALLKELPPHDPHH